MRQYEVVCLTKINPVNANILDEIDGLLTKNQGKIELSENWKQIKLSYPIKKTKEANFMVRIVKTGKENIFTLKNLPRINKDVLRVLVINTEKEKSYVPSVTLSKFKITPLEFHYQITRGRRRSRLNWKESETKSSNSKPTND